MAQVSVTTFPKTSTITNDLYLIGVKDPDNNPQNLLVLAQASGGGSGSGHIIVNSANTVFPQRARLKFSSSFFTIADNLANDETLIGLNTSSFMLKSVFDANGNNRIDIGAGGTGLDLSGGTTTGIATVRNGVALYQRMNYSGALQPTINDDSSLGYQVGSRWIFGSDEWLCVNSTLGNAQWVKVTGSGGGGGSITIQAGGTSLPSRSNLNFLGSGLTYIYDDPLNDATVVQIEQGDMLKGIYDPDFDNIVNIEAGGTGLDLSSQPTGYILNVSGVGTTLLSQNFTATVNPTINDDVTFGYAPGSLWLNGLTTSLYFNSNGTNGAAVWNELGKAIRFRDDANVDKAYKPTIKYKNSSTVNFTLTETTNVLELEANTLANPVDWQVNSPNTTLALRDTMHGKTIRVSGSHQILLPSSTTATLRQGFQVNILLQTSGGTITYLPEDLGVNAVNGRTNTQSEQWSMVNVSYDNTNQNWFLIGLLS